MPHNKSIEELNFINIDEDTVSLSIIEKNDEKKLNILEFANLLDKIAIYYPNLKKLIISNIANVTSKNSGLALSPLEKIENETYQTNLIYLLIDGLSKLQNLEFLEIDSCFLDREENKINKINKAFLPENLNQSKLKFLSLKKTCLNTFDIIPLILFNSGLRELHLLDVNIDYKFNKLTLAINEHSNVKKFKLNLPDYFMQNPRNISSLEDLTNLACLDIANISCLNEVEFKQLYTSVFSLKNLKSLTLSNFSLLNYEPTIIEIKDFCENLAEMTKLQKLDLKNETFYGKFNTYLLDAISKLKHLIILKLPENCLMGLSEALINECLISLVYSLNKLSSLDLNTNFNFIAEGTKTIDNLVKINTLNDLTYTNDNTYNRSFDYLIGKLYKLSNLTNLDISGLLFHNISDLQFNKICNSIDMHPKIQKVAVNNISITRILELKSKTQKYKQDLAAEYLATFLIYKNVVSKRTKPSDKNSLLELISNLPVELIFYICKVITNASLIPTKTLIEKYKSNLDYILKNKCSLKYRESILKPQKEQPLLFNQKEIIAVKPVSRTNVSAEIETKAKRKLMFK